MADGSIFLAKIFVLFLLIILHFRALYQLPKIRLATVKKISIDEDKRIQRIYYKINKNIKKVLKLSHFLNYKNKTIFCKYH